MKREGAEQAAPAWHQNEQNATCGACGEPIMSPEEAALLSSGGQLVHRGGCFVATLATDWRLKSLVRRTGQ